MCGRYALYGPVSRLGSHFGVEFDEIGFEPRYNIAPLQFAPVIRDQAGGRDVALLRWGLLPSWASDTTLAGRLINARAETAAGKPSFRSAFKSRRCLVPVDGFYEWRNSPAGKQPWLFQLASGEPMALAGLWEHREAEGEALTTFTILTTSANALLASVHERMPVILPPETWSLWLNAARTPSQLSPLLVPYNAAGMTARPVSRRLGNARNEGEDLIRADLAGE